MFNYCFNIKKWNQGHIPSFLFFFHFNCFLYLSYFYLEMLIKYNFNLYFLIIIFYLFVNYYLDNI
jgi:hypothetical protein